MRFEWDGGKAMPAGWTVAGVLAHLAFRDQRTVVLIELLQRGASSLR